MKKLTNILILLLITSTSCSTTKNFKWTKKENLKLIELGLTKSDVIILASIVEKETKLVDEKPKIARVYINRLQKNMYLQSDPTIKFAIGDTTLKRILRKHLEINSPYNTYKNKGLPPSPICKPSKKTILAVLNADKNNSWSTILSHEIGHHVERHGLLPNILEELLGNPEKGKVGVFTQIDKSTGKPKITTDENGMKHYELNDEFRELQKTYIDKLANSNVSEKARQAYETPEQFARELFAEIVADRMITGKTSKRVGQSSIYKGTQKCRHRCYCYCYCYCYCCH